MADAPPLEIRATLDNGETLAALGAHLKELDKKFATALRKRMRDGVTKAGEDLVTAVRLKAAWSKRIPAATALKTSFAVKTAGVTITVDAKKAPHARPLEFGNKNTYPGRTKLAQKIAKELHAPRTGRGLRHPVFPDPKKPRSEWNWADMDTRPFFFAAEAAASQKIADDMKQILDDVARDAGFTGD
jgi:hypothetical protein